MISNLAQAGVDLAKVLVTLWDWGHSAPLLNRREEEGEEGDSGDRQQQCQRFHSSGMMLAFS